MSYGRRDEIAKGLATVRHRIEEACSESGRHVDEITLIVVTKFFPASDVLLLHDLGVRDVGENRDQEAGPKYDEVRSRLAAEGRGDIELHFIGRLQSNKARHVARYADVVHSVDRAKLVAPLAAGAEGRARPLDVLVQVSLDGDTSRGGALAEDVPGLAGDIASQDTLRFRGLMAVAPLDADPDASFKHLGDLAASLRAEHPGADWISAGMSGDLEAAIRHGATHLRVGTAILGSRPSLL